MENVYINLKEQNDLYIWNWLRKKHQKDLISVDDLIGDIEDLISENESLHEQLEDKEYERDYYQEYKDHCAENNL